MTTSLDSNKNNKIPTSKEVFRIVIAELLALIIGIMSVISGSLVLLNYKVPNYNILNWLVVYNVILGFISIIAAILMWKKNKSARRLISIILILHVLVLAYLYFFSNEAALESIKAMGFRVSIWIVILLLTYKKLTNNHLN
ncbi:hypothetical protein [Mariniflexile sp.]|uniref:hypothetical protein n=1 Tax=Mariniflexile sp. TaxID=1979402 RepID=UPI0035656B88